MLEITGVKMMVWVEGVSGHGHVPTRTSETQFQDHFFFFNLLSHSFFLVGIRHFRVGPGADPLRCSSWLDCFITSGVYCRAGYLNGESLQPVKLCRSIPLLTHLQGVGFTWVEVWMWASSEPPDGLLCVLKVLLTGALKPLTGWPLVFIKMTLCSSIQLFKAVP